MCSIQRIVSGGSVALLWLAALLAGACDSSDGARHELGASLPVSLFARRIPRCDALIALGSLPKNVKRMFAFPDTKALWKIREIPTCWENPTLADPLDERRRQQVRAAVARTWEAAADVRFVGWERCPEERAPGLRIQVEDTNEGAYTRGLGTHLDGIPAGIVLNFTMTNWRPACGTSDACFEQVAVHEFGHALGFAHEQNRPDEPDRDCRRREQGDPGTCTFCDADHQSIMSYCRPNSLGSSTKLSSCDERSVAALYGRHR